MAKLNQTQRDYFQRRLTAIQKDKRAAFVTQLKASLPDYDVTVPPINRETIRAGTYRMKTLDEILDGNTNWGGFHGGYVNQLFTQVVPDNVKAARDAFDARMVAFDNAQRIQAQRFTDQIMLGGDEAALAALANLEAEEIVLPE